MSKMNQHSASASLPRGFRFSAPRTPEPSCGNNEEAQLPSPPRPRLKLKRRNVSHQLSAPTQQFLASVAAADVPIPSIEEPDTNSGDLNMIGVDTYPQMLPDHIFGQERDVNLLRPRGHAFSPPKTPAPGFVPALTPSRYPNWTIDSVISSSVESSPDPDYESSRPSTSRSTQTSDSLFSRLSQLSDTDRCASPDDGAEKYLLSNDEVYPLDAPTSKGKARRAPWTKAMSDHLWSTYKLYLQDPKVTPFRMGNSSIPPHGVLLRVAREAKRSWRGSKTLIKATNPTVRPKSGSSTPTADEPASFMEWPHTCAATRAHLRELCRLQAASGSQNRGILSRSPTPFSQSAARRWNRRSTPARAPFSHDLSMSLAMSTSDSMQPQGPLAQLTSSSLDQPKPDPSTPHQEQPERMRSPFEGEPSFAERRRLGSPVRSPKSYGPSSSGSLAATLGLGSPMPRRMPHTMGPPRRTQLQSPVRLSRSATVTQKRRNTQCCEPRKRPSIVSDTWLDPNNFAGPQVTVTPAAEFSSSQTTDRDDLFIPRVNAEPTLSASSSMPHVGPSSQLEAPPAPPARLGSPFSAAKSSHSFPNRLHRQQPGSVDLGMLGRPFATIQQITDSTAALRNTNLAGRLAYIDQRLKELRNRDPQRRSQSPKP